MHHKAISSTPYFFLDNGFRLVFNIAHYAQFKERRPMVADSLLDQLDKKLDERYREAKQHIRKLRQFENVLTALDRDGKNPYDAIDLSALDEPMGQEASIKVACEEIVNNCGSRGYYRLPDIVQQLEIRGVGLPKNATRKVRSILNNLVQESKIACNVRRGRAGTTYFPIERKKKN